MIQNAKTNGILAIDTDDRNEYFDMACAVTTNPLMNFSCRRNLFKFEKYSRTDKSNTIKYGEKICITGHSDLINIPLYLHSTLVSPQSFSRFSRNQEVLVVNEKSYNTCWAIEYIDSALKVATEGSPVRAGDQFLLRHCATGRLLASDMVNYFNDYGNEYEVCCHNFQTTNKYQTLISEKEGRLKDDTKIRTECEQNIWQIFG
jgi:dolichyl-phosphate-mannose--protein O-mannosyl transferase